MGWTLAPAIAALQRTLDQARPGRRDRYPDGTIGDDDHAARKSDHNPDADRMVTAVDVHDSEQLDDNELYESLKEAGDRNPVKYVINGGRIWSPTRGERDYDGPNAHPDHCHISVTQAGKRSARDWFLPGITHSRGIVRDEPEEFTIMDKDTRAYLEGMEARIKADTKAHAQTLLRGADHPNLTRLLDGMRAIAKKVGATP